MTSMTPRFPSSSSLLLLLPSLLHLAISNLLCSATYYTRLIMSVPLTKVDSAIAGLSLEEKHDKPPAEIDAKPKKEKPSKRGSISSDKRSSISSEKRGSVAEGVWNIKDLGTSLPS